MYPGIDGFLGTRASLMLDIVVVAMVFILALMALSIWLSRGRRSFQRHKWLQLGLATVLAITVTLFEVDMRINGWRERAQASPYFGTNEAHGAVFTALYVHLVFAVSVPLVWAGVIAAALWRFPRPPAPAAHSRTHRLWGWIAAIDMALTAVTGWIFYWLAFVAS
ncbi:MAG: DUF420 domain-containing protein [Pirellulales bacterium]|nr:DUF420 domain-containing protein [Pirellulales bacterium]